MAFNDTLFQLGMDLIRSSTAQKEDHARAAFNVEVEDRSSGPIDHSVSSAGTSVFIDLHGVKRLDDAKSVERAVKRAVECLGLKLKTVRSDRSAGGRVSGIATLSNGRVAFHACSRSGFATIDATGCAGLKPEAALIALANTFEAREAVIKRMRTTVPTTLPAPRVSAKASRKATVSRIHAKAA